MTNLETDAEWLRRAANERTDLDPEERDRLRSIAARLPVEPAPRAERTLLPCPFCGHRAEENTDDSGWDQIICGGCGCRSAETRGVGRPDATDIWNRRVPVEPREDPLADVRWICSHCTTVNGIDSVACLGCRKPREEHDSRVNRGEERG